MEGLKMTKETNEIRIKTLLHDTSFEDYEISDYDDYDAIIEELENQITQEDIIYYYKAMRYLSDNDQSLKDSLTLARDFGCTLEHLNSETLATILLQDKLQTELYELSEDIKNLIQN